MADFNERYPFGKGATVIGGDNIHFSQLRHQAVQRYRQGQATPEDMALLYETDRAMQTILKEEDNG